jgi:hypothetical protein
LTEIKIFEEIVNFGVQNITGAYKKDFVFKTDLM